MSNIPSRRVMNWTEHGVQDPDSKGRWCGVRHQECNVDSKYIGAPEVQTAIEMCSRKPCICRGEKPR